MRVWRKHGLGNMALNVKELLERRLPAEIVGVLKEAGEEANETGSEAYLVGGVVRDLFLGRGNVDLDVVVEGDAIGLAKRLAERYKVRLVSHSRFGTAKLRFATFSLDIATARTETYSHPGALPAVKPGTIVDDLKRRDFSINAMAVCLMPGRFGGLFDPLGGKEDMDNGLVRVLHDRSFVDDATRILRGIRYEQRLGFRFEENTERLLRRDVKMLHTISGDRLRHELERTLEEEEPERALRRADELGVLQELYLALKGDGWLAKVYRRARRGGRKPLASLYLCLLCYQLSEQEAAGLLEHLNFPARARRAVLDTVRLKKEVNKLASADIKPSAVYELLHTYDNVAIEANLLAGGSPLAKRHLQLYLSKLRYVRTLLDGVDLAALGIAVGPAIGEALNALRAARLDGEVKTRRDEVEFIRSRFLSQD